MESEKTGIIGFYDKNYKKLLIIPFLMLILAMISISYQYVNTGDFMYRDVSLKGGLTITIPVDQDVDVIALKNHLSSQFPQNDISVRSLKTAGKQMGIIINSDMDGTKQSDVDVLLDSIQSNINVPLDDYSVEFVGSSLGASFFKEALKSIYVAFLFMGAVVFLYFGSKLSHKVLAMSSAFIAALLIFIVKTTVTDIIAYLIGAFLLVLYIRDSAPSLAVIVAAFSDIVITLAIVNLLGMKISTAGIAAFLILIGYSVDTDILLSTRVLKRKQGTLIERIVGAIKTGTMMSVTTIAAASVALFLTHSDVLNQIMTILLIGLIVDYMNTWIQNVGILRLYLEKKSKS